MRKIQSTIITILTVGMLVSVQAQENYTASIDGWKVDMEKAYQESQETGNPILANFTGTDWCIWCKRLKAAVFVKDDFKKWADKNVVLLELDFPRRKQLPQEIRKQNAQLRKLFKVRGYPTVWLFHLDKNDKGDFKINALGKTGYTRTSEKFISDLERMIKKGESSSESM